MYLCRFVIIKAKVSGTKTFIDEDTLFSSFFTRYFWHIRWRQNPSIMVHQQDLLCLTFIPVGSWLSSFHPAD